MWVDICTVCTKVYEGCCICVTSWMHVIVITPKLERQADTDG